MVDVCLVGLDRSFRFQSLTWNLTVVEFMTMVLFQGLMFGFRVECMGINGFDHFFVCSVRNVEYSQPSTSMMMVVQCGMVVTVYLFELFAVFCIW